MHTRWYLALTEWPVRVGMYETRDATGKIVARCHWDGEQWWCADRLAGTVQVVQWRGLLEPPAYPEERDIARPNSYDVVISRSRTLTCRVYQMAKDRWLAVGGEDYRRIEAEAETEEAAAHAWARLAGAPYSRRQPKLSRRTAQP